MFHLNLPMKAGQVYFFLALDLAVILSSEAQCTVDMHN
jgi:hypothetical protein